MRCGWQRAWGRCFGGRKKRDGLRADRARLIQQPVQSQPGEGALAASADEFAAHAMARIRPGFLNHDRHTQLPQSDAQRQTREATADNHDRLAHDSSHFLRDE